LLQQAVVVRDPVPEALKQAHALRHVSPHHRAMRKGMSKLLPPQLLVGLAEESGPEAERGARDDPTSCDRLTSVEALDGDDDHAEACSSQVGVPVVPRERSFMILTDLVQERLEAGRRKPGLGLVPLHDRATPLSDARSRPRAPAKELCGRGLVFSETVFAHLIPAITRPGGGRMHRMRVLASVPGPLYVDGNWRIRVINRAGARLLRRPDRRG
jgi:hypothetical protein